MAVEARTIFEATSKTPQELLSDSGLGLYIPSYQRPYSWDKEKVNRLMEDLSHGIKTLLKHDDSFTFLGTVITIHDTNNSTVQPIVREDVPSKVLTVIDGQQRMTTLIVLCLALHNQISLQYKSLLKKKKQIQKTISDQDLNLSLDLGDEVQSDVEIQLDAYEWLEGKTQDILNLLSKTFYEKQAYGKSPLYPRMIRSLDDQWSKSENSRRYFSPIANLIFNYITQIDNPNYEIVEYKPEARDNIEGEKAIVERYIQIIRLLSSLLNKKITAVYMEEVPEIDEMYESDQLQEALLGYTINKKFLSSLNNDEKIVFDNLARLIFYANYVLKRVVLTVVKGKNEDYAFTIFESLNTTGEPLTAFETFKPRVVNAVGLENYEGSEQKRLMDEIAGYLSTYAVGNSLQNATKDLLIQFLATYSGVKISKRLAEQRSALKEVFENAPQEEQLILIKTLNHCANFKRYLWESENYNDLSQFFGNNQLSSLSKLCLKFLSDIKHTIVIPILTIFFKQVVEEADSELKKQRFDDFENALKSIVAFTLLWRSSRQGTSGIDNEYRELLSRFEESTNFNPICISKNKNQVIDIQSFKAELRSRLQSPNRKGRLENREIYIQSAYSKDIYQMPKIAKMLLLASHHDCIDDSANPGFILKGKEATNPCLLIEEYLDDKNLSLEHIAPQNSLGKWDQSLYQNSDTIHTLGNLTLVSHQLNASLNNRIWAEKRVFYKVIGARTTTDAQSILAEAAEKYGISFREYSHDILTAQKYMPNLIALGSYEETYHAEFVENRSKQLHGLAWDELIGWLS
ncbi:DUF262 domain-containing protein [Moraxella canis]|uniref:DUF262 domain-containing protein n=1 Tax=Moraxella canis TaxID=90239 RepID=UPI0006699FEB|nr:DUF262 domain-containing HNH endonuclease family protein [Moraxella canis]